MLESDKLLLRSEDEPEKNLADAGVVKTEKETPEKKENKPDFAKVQEAVKEQALAIKQELKERKPFFSPKTAEILGTALVSMQLLLTGCGGGKPADAETKPAVADVDQETIDKLKKQLAEDFDKKWKEKEEANKSPKAAAPAAPVASAPKIVAEKPSGPSVLEMPGAASPKREWNPFPPSVSLPGVSRAEKTEEKIEKEKKDKVLVKNLQEWTGADKVEMLSDEDILITINGQGYVITPHVLKLLENENKKTESEIEGVHKTFGEMANGARAGIFRSALKKKEDIRRNEETKVKRMRKIIKDECDKF
jgi:hypothetical protein